MANSYLRTVRLNVRLGNLLAITTAAAVGAPSPQSLLHQALHFADFYNWYAARPLFEQSRRLFEAAGDNRNRLYARCGAIRAGAEPAPISELSYRLERELATNPLLQSDKELRMFCLAIKGDFDGEIDSVAMRRDWEEVRSLADELGNAKWRYRAQAQLGFADYYDGDVSASQRNAASALLGATQINDVGEQIFILGAIADGQVNQGMDDQGLDFADRAISLARTCRRIVLRFVVGLRHNRPGAIFPRAPRLPRFAWERRIPIYRKERPSNIRIGTRFRSMETWPTWLQPSTRVTTCS
jgi:hypothetical protein